MDAQLREVRSPPSRCVSPFTDHSNGIAHPFLRDRNPQVRQIALENLLPQTVKGAPHRDIFFAGFSSGGLQKPKENELVRDLKVLCRDQLVWCAETSCLHSDLMFCRA